MITAYSQKDKAWARKKLGTCSSTIGGYGCFLVSLSMLDGRDPLTLNELFKKEGVYSNGCLMVGARAGKVLGMTYERTTTNPGITCIAETNHYAPSVPQHFYILLEDGNILDPLDLNPRPKKNPYNIVSYRVFKTTKESSEVPEEEPYADKYNECSGELSIAKKEIEEFKDQIDKWKRAEQNYMRKLDEYIVSNREYSKELNQCQKEKEEILGGVFPSKPWKESKTIWYSAAIAAAGTALAVYESDPTIGVSALVVAAGNVYLRTITYAAIKGKNDEQ